MERSNRSVDNVRPVASALTGLGDWLGYHVNPLSKQGDQFHDRPERLHGAELFFPLEGRWMRAFYWHSLPEPGLGVVTFVDCPASVSASEYPV